MSEFFLGIDAGTSSCGWAVTNGNYEIVRAKGKKLWGVRLFDEAQTAEERRVFRTGRRRLERRKLKFSWLQEIFAGEVESVDPNFFDRLKYSSLWKEDKEGVSENLKTKDSLFFGEIEGMKYSDRDFFEDYPTIYHLRKELTRLPAKDIRFLYLALHNIVKHRGHFLFEGAFGENQSLAGVVNEFIDIFNSIEIEGSSFKKFDSVKEAEMLEIFKGKDGIKVTKQKFCKFFNVKTKAEKAVVCAMVDGKINLQDVFEIDGDIEGKINFDDEEFEGKLASLSFLGDEEVQMIEKLKTVFSTLALKKFLGDNNYICEAQVALFEKHQSQLAEFKKFIKQYYPKEYSKMFRVGQSKKFPYVNYAVYVGGSIFDGQKKVVRLGGTSAVSREDFYSYVKKVLSGGVEGDAEFEEGRAKILSAIEKGDFLNKQRSKTNAVFSNKLYLNEAEKILEVNQEKYPFLKERDASGLTNAQKILKIIEFRVPYFVGPIGEKNGGGRVEHWAIKEKELPLRPWTLDKMVDFDRAEESFISRMTGKCSQLPGEDVLPKQSILYSKFMVLDELNNLRINGEEISVQLKQQIFDGLFTRENKVTIKKLREFLKAESGEESKEYIFSGINKEFKNNLGVYVKLAQSENFGRSFVDKNLDMIEEVIKLKTIIADKARLERRIVAKFGDRLNDAQIKELRGLTCSGWGRLSKKFLAGIDFVDRQTGEVTTVIGRLWDTNQNLMQIVNDTNLTLLEKLRAERKAKVDSIAYQDVDDLYCSPAVKRSVWQVLKIIDEVKGTLGKMPDKIFVEVAREKKPDEGEKLSRKNKLLEKYQSADFKNAVAGMTLDIQRLLDELNHDDTASKIKSEKLYLYFLQLGKCAYTGEPLSIDEVFNERSCDVDHIIPQALIKDDSLDNKVLVRSQYNRAKEADYPIANKHPEWVKGQQYFWKTLNKCGLMSEEKLARLIRQTSLSDEEIGEFIARQMVETHQTAKAVIELLKGMVDDPRRIVYSKAKMSNEFKVQADLLKSRTVNDLHHAKDAYINIVAGNVLHCRFTDDPRHFYIQKNKNSKTTKNVSKIFQNNVYSPKTGEIIWRGKDDILRVKEICERDDCLVSRMSYTKKNAQFYDATIYKNERNSKLIGEKTKAKINLKGDKNPISDIAKYGGYDKETIAYYMLIESQKKGEKIRTIESVPVVAYQKFKNQKDCDRKIFEYIVQRYNLENAKLLIPKINLKSTIKIGGGEYWLTAKTGREYGLQNANQWHAPRWCVQIVKNLDKFAELERKRNLAGVEISDDFIAFAQADKTLNQERLITKEKNLALYDEVTKQLGKKCYQGAQLARVADTLLDERDKFKDLSIAEQVRELRAIVGGLATGTKGVKFIKLYDGKTTGIVKINKDITDKNLSLIMRSQTGIYEKKIRL